MTQLRIATNLVIALHLPSNYMVGPMCVNSPSMEQMGLG